MTFWRRQILTRVRVAVIELWVAVVIVVAWWVFSAGSESFYFPPLADILTRFSELWLFDAVPKYLLPSLANLGIGFLTATLVGLALGVMFGMLPRVHKAFWLVLELARSTPMITLIPLAIMFFGVGSTEKIVLIAFASVWPVLLNTTDGLRAVEPLLIDTARAYAMSSRRLLFQVMVPAASPQIMAGIRVAISIAVTMMVGSELFASSDGIGHFVLLTRETSAMTDLWTTILLLGLLGYLLNLVFTAIEFKLLDWHRGLRASSRNDQSGGS